MIYLKLILAFLLSAMPFLYVSFIKPKRETSSVWRNMFTAIGSLLPRLNTVKVACSMFLHRIYNGMKRSDNFRKFFMLVTLLFMIAVQFVDFNASTEIAKDIMNTPYVDSQTNETVAQLLNVFTVYSPLMTKPHATLLAAALSMIIFAYKSGDWLLTQLHNSQKFFFFVAVAALTILFTSPRFLIVVEIVEIILMAALIYPNRIVPPGTKGRKDIPEEQQIMEFIKDVA